MSAELHAIKEAIRYILRQPSGQWTIFTDSKAALQSVLRNDCFSIHQHASREITHLHHLAKDIVHPVTFQWIPGHCGVPRNEKAHEAARRSLQMHNRRKVFFTKHDASAMTKELVLMERNRLWSLPEHHYAFLHYVDPELRINLPERFLR